MKKNLIFIILLTVGGFLLWFFTEPESFTNGNSNIEPPLVVLKQNRSTLSLITEEEKSICNGLVEKLKGLISLQNTQQQNMKSYFGQLLQKDISWQELDFLIEKSNISILDTSSFLPKNTTLSSFVKNIMLTFDLRVIFGKESRALESLVLNKELTKIGGFVGQGSQKKLYSGKPLFFYVIQKANDEDANDLISILLAQGLRPTLLDIVWAVQNKLEFSVIENLILYTNDNDQYWMDGDKLQSLEIILATEFNAQLLELWLNKANPIEGDDDLFYSELDMIPVPTSLEMRNALETVNILLKHERSPKTYLGLRRLASWLPTDLTLSIQEKMNLYNDNTTINVEIHLAELKQLGKQYLNNLEEQKKINGLCPSEIAKKRKELSNQPELLSYSDKLSEFQNQLSRVGFVLGAIGELPHVSLSGDLLIKRNELNQALIKKNWELIKEIIPSFLGTENELLVLNAAMEEALVSNAPISFIQHLFDLGAELPTNAIHLLVLGNNLNLTRELFSFGLNIHTTDVFNFNAVSYLTYLGNSTIARNRSQMLVFLLERGVNYHSIGGSLSPLDLALKNINKSQYSLIYARTLIDYGADIELSNRQQMKKLKDNDINKYMGVINIIPELAID